LRIKENVEHIHLSVNNPVKNPDKILDGNRVHPREDNCDVEGLSHNGGITIRER